MQTEGSVTPGERMKNARRAHWKMVYAPLFVVIRYSFVERAAPTFLICDHSLDASSSAHTFKHVQNWARNSVHKNVHVEGRQKDAGHARAAMDQRPIHAIHAEHSLDIRRMFVGWDVANTHWDVELSPILVVQLMTSTSTSNVFWQRFHIPGPTTVTTTNGSTLLSSWHS